MRKISSILFFLALASFGFSQKTTLTVKKQKQIEGLYYHKLNDYKHKYMRFEGDSVAVWISPRKYKDVSDISYSDYVNSKLKKTTYKITDSLLTFTFSTKTRAGEYIFEDYHCILDNLEKLYIKKGSTIKVVQIEVYHLVLPQKRKGWFRRRN